MLSTHLLEEAEALCDRVAILVGGRLQAWGTVDEVRSLAGGRSLEEAFVQAIGNHTFAGRGGGATAGGLAAGTAVGDQAGGGSPAS
ncbi:MAG: hypothetical protein HY660_06795 [Armatimonadetes bacterium]|nr:hypothetical protein [Armatimonadota bacterium]